MAGKPMIRLNSRHQEMVKAKINSGNLIKLLEDHALGKNIISDSTRIQAAKILLDYVISKAPAYTMQDIELSGKDGGPIQHELRPQLSREEWLKAFGIGGPAE